MTDGTMGSLLVLDTDPSRADNADLIETLELIGVKHLDTEGAAESSCQQPLHFTHAARATLC